MGGIIIYNESSQTVIKVVLLKTIKDIEKIILNEEE